MLITEDPVLHCPEVSFVMQARQGVLYAKGQWACSADPGG